MKTVNYKIVKAENYYSPDAIGADLSHFFPSLIGAEYTANLSDGIVDTRAEIERRLNNQINHAYAHFIAGIVQ